MKAFLYFARPTRVITKGFVLVANCPTTRCATPMDPNQSSEIVEFTVHGQRGRSPRSNGDAGTAF